MFELFLSTPGAAPPGLDNLPTNPTQAWAVLIVVALAAISPMLVAKYQAKKADDKDKGSKATTNTNTQSVVIGGSVTPHIDASQQLLTTVVGNLEERARQAELKYDELERRHLDLVRNVTRSELKVEMLEARVRDLENENSVLLGRLSER